MADETTPTPAPVARRAFACAVCGNEAGRVELFGREGGAGEIIRQSFTSLLTYRVEPDEFARVRAVVAAGDAGTLHDFNCEVACFYCPACRACFCGEHWARWDVFDDEDGFLWHDSIRGRCPAGHERMLED